MIRRCLPILLCSTLLCSACPPDKPQPVRGAGVAAGSETVLVVAGEEMSVDEFDRRLNALPPSARARYGTTEQQQDFLNAQLQFEIMADRAERLGYGDDVRVVEDTSQALATRRLRREAGQTEPTFEELQAWYEENQDRFTTPKRRRTYALVLDETSRRATVARALADESLDLEAFRALAAEHAAEPFAAARGDVGWVLPPDADEQDGWKSEVAPLVFATDHTSPLRGPVSTQRGETWLWVGEIREDPAPPLESIEESVRREYVESRRAQARRKLIERLRPEYEVTVDRERAAEVDAETERDTRP